MKHHGDVDRLAAKTDYFNISNLFWQVKKTGPNRSKIVFAKFKFSLTCVLHNGSL